MTSVAEAPPQSATRAFSIEREGELAILWFDLPGEKVNKFSSAVLRELSGVIDEMSWTIVVLVAIALVVWTYLTYTAPGRATYAIGGNPRAAAFAGVGWGR